MLNCTPILNILLLLLLKCANLPGICAVGSHQHFIPVTLWKSLVLPIIDFCSQLSVKKMSAKMEAVYVSMNGHAQPSPESNGIDFV